MNNAPRFKKRTILLIVYLVFAILPIYWMVNMSFKTQPGDPVHVLAVAAGLHLGQLPDDLHRRARGTRATSTA